jgi:hypothetical protein
MRSAAESSAEVLVGQNEVAEEILKGNRSQQFRQLLQPPAPTGRAFMGPSPKQEVIDFGTADLSLRESTRTTPDIVRQIVQGPITRNQYNLEQAATGGTGYFERYVGTSNKKELVEESIPKSTSKTIRDNVYDPTYGKVTYMPEAPKREKEENKVPTGAIGQREFKEITARQRTEDAADAATKAARAKADESRAPLPGQYMFDFQDPAKPGVMISRQFLGGTIRPLTDAEASVEQSGWNTVRGMNPRGIKDRPTQATPPSSGILELSNQPDKGIELPPPATPTAPPFQGFETVNGKQVRKKLPKEGERLKRRTAEQKLRTELATDRSKPQAGERPVAVGDVETGQEGIALVTTDKKTGDKVTRKLRGGSTIRNERAASKKKT